MVVSHQLQVASAPQQVLSPKRLRQGNPLVLTAPVAPQTVVSTLPPVISSHLLNNNYLLASQSQAAAVANFTHPHHPLSPFHHQPSSILQNLPLPIAVKSPVLTQIKSIINSSSPSATIPTQIPNYIATAQQQQQQQQQIKSINTPTSFNSLPAAVISQATNSTTQSSIVPITIGSNSPVSTSPLSTTPNMDQVGQIGQNPMQSHPLSQSMDSVNTASNEEEVSGYSLLEVVKQTLRCRVLLRRKSVYELWRKA